MKKASEQTLLTALVNYKCVGYFGKVLRSFNLRDKRTIINELINREWITNDMQLTEKGHSLVKDNINLCQY